MNESTFITITGIAILISVTVLFSVNSLNVQQCISTYHKLHYSWYACMTDQSESLVNLMYYYSMTIVRSKFTDGT